MLGESTKKSSPFRVPEDYFRDLNVRIINNLPNEEAFVLGKDDNKNSFKVPENYFSDFNSRIMEVLPENKEIKDKKIRPLWKKIVPWVAVAAVFTGILITSSFLELSPTSNVNNKQMIENSSIAAYDEAEDFYLFLSDEVAETAIYNESFFE